METPIAECALRLIDEEYLLDDYQGRTPRWCTGCGDSAILAAVQRMCRNEQLPPEKTVFVSGIGCSSRFPHYMRSYGFHGLHGRALPVAEGIKLRRPDLHVFVITGDGDCCSIGTAHWIHALRYNMDMTVLMHDNGIYGLTKNQASPTSPLGLESKTTPHGNQLEPINPVSVSLGIRNVSFVAQAADWIPDQLLEIIEAAFHHKGLSFVRVLQRCPEFLPGRFDPWMQDPDRMLLLHHGDGIGIGPNLAKVYRNQERHDPSDRNRAREIASTDDPMPVGVLYRNPHVPCYEDLRKPDRLYTPDIVKTVLEREFDKFTIHPAA
ncbi:MAG: thiamine pyrophosphate-dependent enzyme [Alphaproteobacteria bacterium]